MPNSNTTKNGKTPSYHPGAPGRTSQPPAAMRSTRSGAAGRQRNWEREAVETLMREVQQANELVDQLSQENDELQDQLADLGATVQLPGVAGGSADLKQAVRHSSFPPAVGSADEKAIATDPLDHPEATTPGPLLDVPGQKAQPSA